MHAGYKKMVNILRFYWRLNSNVLAMMLTNRQWSTMPNLNFSIPFSTRFIVPQFNEKEKGKTCRAVGAKRL